LDNVNKIIEYNQKFIDYLDFRSSHGALLSDKVIRNKNLFDLVNRGKFRPFETFLQQAKGAKKGSFNESINYKNRDLNITVTAINLPLEGFIGSSLTLRDVTADVEMEGLRKKTELKLKQAKETAEDIAQSKSDFLSTAAHELRTPLTSIQGFSEILLTRDPLSDTLRKKYLGYINKQAKDLGQIINDLLDISRIESGRSFILEKAEVSMNEFLDHLLEVFRQQSHLRSECHQFTLELPEKSPLLSIDAEKMSSVMKNLVSNAVKYSPDGGTIEIGGVVSGAVYQVSISDQGLGMTPEQVERVFEKFYRVDASNTSTEGTGLGMTIAKNIVEAHGGNIWIESELGQGTTVRFFIPMD
jgi:signal transduction histidine kinase